MGKVPWEAPFCKPGFTHNARSRPATKRTRHPHRRPPRARLQLPVPSAARLPVRIPGTGRAGREALVTLSPSPSHQTLMASHQTVLMASHPTPPPPRSAPFCPPPPPVAAFGADPRLEGWAATAAPAGLARGRDIRYAPGCRLSRPDTRASHELSLSLSSLPLPLPLPL